MFNHLDAIPADPILGLITAHAADSNPNKIDLGIGVYRDEHGATPMLNCVKQAEKTFLLAQEYNDYLTDSSRVELSELLIQTRAAMTPEPPLDMIAGLWPVGWIVESGPGLPPESLDPRGSSTWLGGVRRGERWPERSARSP